MLVTSLLFWLTGVSRNPCEPYSPYSYFLSAAPKKRDTPLRLRSNDFSKSLDDSLHYGFVSAQQLRWCLLIFLIIQITRRTFLNFLTRRWCVCSGDVCIWSLFAVDLLIKISFADPSARLIFLVCILSHPISSPLSPQQLFAHALSRAVSPSEKPLPVPMRKRRRLIVMLPLGSFWWRFRMYLRKGSMGWNLPIHTYELQTCTLYKHVWYFKLWAGEKTKYGCTNHSYCVNSTTFFWQT